MISIKFLNKFSELFLGLKIYSYVMLVVVVVVFFGGGGGGDCCWFCWFFWADSLKNS